MNSKRRAELQRKLSMGAVPRPPAGLADRIKSDIPKYLQTEPERERFSRSVAFSMRIAASILLLITSVFVTLNLLEPDQPMARIAAPSAVPPRTDEAVLRTMTTNRKVAPEAPAEEIRLEVAEEIPAAKVAPAAPRMRLAENPAQRGEIQAQATRQERYVEDSIQESIVVSAEAPPARDTAAIAASVAAPEPVPAPAPPPPAAAPAMAERRAAPATGASTVVREAYAADLELAQKKNVFGITVDPEVFRRIKTSLESGVKPVNGSVNVEALVNYFAGTPAKPPRRGVRLEVEASPVPVGAEGDHAVLRFTIDTPHFAAKEGESIPPAARDARVSIDFNADAVKSVRRVGDDGAIAAESVLLHNVSVTALYDLELVPRLRSSQRLATVRLEYRSVTDGGSHTIERVIQARDLTRDWAHSSRRHRLASLGAVWGESLQGSPQGVDVARRAEELATQNPKDPLARELANAASASGGGR